MSPAGEGLHEDELVEAAQRRPEVPAPLPVEPHGHVLPEPVLLVPGFLAGDGSLALMRRALQYSGVTGRLLALHEEEPTLSRDGQMHEGAVSAELGLAGWPSVTLSIDE